MRPRIPLFLAVCAVAVAAQEPAPQQPPFRTGTNLVRVDVNIMDRRSEPIKDLTAEDFEVKEEELGRPITSFKLLGATDGLPTISRFPSDPGNTPPEAARDDVRVFLLFWDEYHIGQFVLPSGARAARELRARRLWPHRSRRLHGSADDARFDPLHA